MTDLPPPARGTMPRLSSHRFCAAPCCVTAGTALLAACTPRCPRPARRNPIPPAAPPRSLPTAPLRHLRPGQAAVPTVPSVPASRPPGRAGAPRTGGTLIVAQDRRGHRSRSPARLQPRAAADHDADLQQPGQALQRPGHPAGPRRDLEGLAGRQADRLHPAPGRPLAPAGQPRAHRRRRQVQLRAPAARVARQDRLRGDRRRRGAWTSTTSASSSTPPTPASWP